MGRLSALTVLLSISGIFLSNHCTNGQATTTTVSTASRESSHFNTTTTAGHVMANSNTEPTVTGSRESNLTTTIAGHEMANSNTVPTVTGSRETSQMNTTPKAGDVLTNSHAVPVGTGSGVLHFETTTTARAVVSNPDVCPSYLQSGLNLCASMVGLADVTSLLTLPDFDVCSLSLLQYSCAKLESVPENKLSAILKCFMTNGNAIISVESFTLFCNQLSMDTLTNLLKNINQEVPSSKITATCKDDLLRAMWEKVRQDPALMTAGSITLLFGNLMYPFMSSIRLETLNCASTSAMSCDGMKALVTVLSNHYSSFEYITDPEIAMWTTNFIRLHSCQETTLADTVASYQIFWKYTKLTDVEKALGKQNWTDVAGMLTESQLSEFVANTDAFAGEETASPVMAALKTQDFKYNNKFLSRLPEKYYSANLNVTSALLDNYLNKIASEDDPVCKPDYKTAFQGNVNYLLVAINETILQKIIANLKDCSEYEDIYTRIDMVYDMLTADMQQKVCDSRTKFLTSQLSQTGSACAFGLNSLTWLENMFGRSIGLINYSVIVQLNSAFDPFAAMTLLNKELTVAALINTSIFTTLNFPDTKKCVASVIDAWKRKGPEYVSSVLVDLKISMIKLKIVKIESLEVRLEMFVGIWDILTPYLLLMKSEVWDSLSFFIASIVTVQLNDISMDVVQNCSNMQTIVHSLSLGHRDMNDASKLNVTNWISAMLQQLPNSCKDMEGNWLPTCFGAFIVDVTITTIIEINPEYNLTDAIPILSADQLGQLCVKESRALIDVKFMKIVFVQLTKKDHKENLKILARFWLSFNVHYEKVMNFSVEVKYIMLSVTFLELAPDFISFSEKEFVFWFTNFRWVISVITAELLIKIPLEIPCSCQKVVIKSLDGAYSDTAPENRADVLNYIEDARAFDLKRPEAERCTATETSTVIKIQISYGFSYCGLLSYKKLSTEIPGFSWTESGVMDILTDDQLGDMMVVEDIYKSEEKADQCFAYLKTQLSWKVNAVIARFSETCQKQNIRIENVAVGTKILGSYVAIIKDDMKTYNSTGITMFFGSITVLLPFCTSDTLAPFNVQDCEMLAAIVNELNKGIGEMSDSTKTGLASWIVGKLGSPSLGGCTSNYTTSSAWIDLYWKEFFGYCDLTEVMKINNQLDVSLVINQTSVTQKAEYFCSENVSKNVTAAAIVLESLKGTDGVIATQTVFQFMTSLNIEIKISVTTMTKEVKTLVMTYLFGSCMKNYGSMTSEQITGFAGYFKYFLGYITYDLVLLIPLNMDCNGYTNIFQALGSVSVEFPDEMPVAIFGRMMAYMTSNGSSDVCSSMYKDSTTFILVMFGNFSSLASFYDFQRCNSKFDGYSCLSILTAKQISQGFIATGAFNIQINAAQMCVELTKRNSKERMLFLNNLNLEAKKKGITKLPDRGIQEMVFEVCKQEVLLEWTSGDNMTSENPPDLLISCVRVSDINSMSKGVSCRSQMNMVYRLGLVISDLSDGVAQAFCQSINTYNKQVQDTTGSPCPTEPSGSDAWLDFVYGKFITFATLKDFQDCNKNFDAVVALPSCTGSQVAQYAIQYQAFDNIQSMIPVVDSLVTYEGWKEFFQACNKDAREKLKTSPAVDMIMDKFFEVIKMQMNNFQPLQWEECMKLIEVIIYKINVTQHLTIDYPMNCESFQNLIAGLNKGFPDMSEETRKSVYTGCIQPQLNSVPSTSGIKCGQPKDNTEVWKQVNCGEFGGLIGVEEFIKWNINYKITEEIGYMSSNQLGYVAASAATNEDVACQVAARVKAFDSIEVTSFLDNLSSTLKENKQRMSKGSSSKLSSATFSAVGISLSSSSPLDLYKMVTNLGPLMNGIDSEQLTMLLSNADCRTYELIVPQLSSVYNDFDTNTSQSLSDALYAYMMKKKKNSESCTKEGEDSRIAIKTLIGRFSASWSISRFYDVFASFDWLDVSDSLTPAQLAQCYMKDMMSSNEDKANVLNAALANMSDSNIIEFINAFQAIAKQRNMEVFPEGSIKQSTYDLLYGRVIQLSISLSISITAQWTSCFSFLVLSFPSYFQMKHVEQIPDTLGSSGLQFVVAIFSKASMTDDVTNAMCGKVISNLKNMPSNGIDASMSSSDWYSRYFGLIGKNISLAEIEKSNPGFDALQACNVITTEQLATYTANKNVLSDTGKVEKVMSVITSQNINAFLNSFNEECDKNGITSINSGAAELILRRVTCVIEYEFKSFTAVDYGQLFQNVGKLLLTRLIGNFLRSIPDGIGCGSVATIMTTLSTVGNTQSYGDIFYFVKRQLMAQKESQGNACTDGLDLNTWVLTYFGKCLIAASWKDIEGMNPNFDVAEGVNLLSPTQLAEASIEPTRINNLTCMTIVMKAFNQDLSNTEIFVNLWVTEVALKSDLLSNSKSIVFVASTIARTVFGEMGTFTLQIAQSWMNKICPFLLYVNQTSFEYLSMTTDCPQLQIFVSCMNPMYSSLTDGIKQAVANVIKNILEYKKNSGDDPCTMGSSDPVESLLKKFCKQLSPDTMKNIWPDMNTVSYDEKCKAIFENS